MSSPLRVALLFGGRSVEHEISVISARGVARAIREAGLECVPVGVDGDGRWLGPERSSEILDGDGARVEPGQRASSIALEPGRCHLVRLDPAGAPIAIDVVFPLLHGWGGEDGRLQGALDLCGIPYVGPGVTGSALGMDKIASKHVFAAHDLPLVPWIDLPRAAAQARDRVRERVGAELGYPVFVKPANGGSSVGVSKVRGAADLDAALDEALGLDHAVVVERAVPAREIECAVLGNDEPRASILGEIAPAREFYDYRAKYLEDTTRLEIPAPLDEATTGAIRGWAIAAFRALGLAGLARVDFLLDREDGTAYLNEVNTLPGFTPISMFPKLWEASGLGFPRLVARLVELALARCEADRGLRTRWRAD